MLLECHADDIAGANGSSVVLWPSRVGLGWEAAGSPYGNPTLAKNAINGHAATLWLRAAHPRLVANGVVNATPGPHTFVICSNPTDSEATAATRSYFLSAKTLSNQSEPDFVIGHTGNTGDPLRRASGYYDANPTTPPYDSAITDGWHKFYSNQVPIFCRAGWQVSVFVIDSSSFWLRDGEPLGYDYPTSYLAQPLNTTIMGSSATAAIVDENSSTATFFNGHIAYLKILLGSVTVSEAKYLWARTVTDFGEMGLY